MQDCACPSAMNGPSASGNLENGAKKQTWATVCLSLCLKAAVSLGLQEEPNCKSSYTHSQEDANKELLCAH